MEKTYKILQNRLNSEEFEDFFNHKILWYGINYEKKMKIYRFFNNIFFIILVLNTIALFLFHKKRHTSHSIAELIGIPPEMHMQAIIIISILYILIILGIVWISKSYDIQNKMFFKLLSFFKEIYIRTSDTNSFENIIYNAKCLPSFDKCYTSKELSFSYQKTLVNLFEFSLKKEPKFLEKNEKPILTGLCMAIHSRIKSDKGGVIITNKGNTFFENQDLDIYYKKIKILEYSELCQKYNIYTLDKESMENTLTESRINGLIELENNNIFKKKDIVILFNYDSSTYIIIKNKKNNVLIDFEDSLSEISMYKQKLNELLSCIEIIDKLELQ